MGCILRAVWKCCGKVKAHMRLHRVLRNTLAPAVHPPQVELRICIALLGGLWFYRQNHVKAVKSIS